MFNPLKHTICLETPLRLVESAWVEHVPFGMTLIDLLRPRVLVELGAYSGVSYCAFCQAVKTLGTDTYCYAIDTWEGDPHTGSYGNELLQELREHHDPLYESFSRLVQSTFESAIDHFADGTVDLLHIDGFHTYDAAKRDFQTWFPKMSGRGVIILHDINVRERGFGIWKLWDELKVDYPHFAFVHGNGLGVLGVGPQQCQLLHEFFNVSETEVVAVRKFYQLLGLRHQASCGQVRLSQSLTEIRELKTEVDDLRRYIKAVQELWSVRFLQVLANEGLISLVNKSIMKLRPRVLPPPLKDWWSRKTGL